MQTGQAARTPGSRHGWVARVRARLSQLGPGLITGAADDDPSGIATYSQAGAQFGYGMLWTVIFTLPLMAAVQIVSARIGYVTGRGLAANIRSAYPRPVLWGVVGLLMAANTINIAADIAAMADALRMLAGGSAHAWAFLLGGVSLVLQVFLPYERYVRWLKWLTLALFAYVAVAFMVRIEWWDVARRIAWPALPLSGSVVLMVVAVFGTTISPYLFFWQAAQEMEERHLAHPSRHTSHGVRRHLRRIKFDTNAGMTFSNAVAFFIMLATAATLHAAGITQIETSQQAAQALRPVAGDHAYLLFALGIVGTGLLAVPVLAGSAAYAVAEAAGWKEGLDLKLEHGEGRGFYAVLAAATAGGVALGFAPIDPVRQLFWAAVINGVIAVPVMAVMMRIASRRDLMGEHVIGHRLRRSGWIATGVMSLAVLALFASLLARP